MRPLEATTTAGDRRVDAALKEWRSVVEALALGRGSIIVRKGGILEAKHGFRLEHERFLLLPTEWHEHESRGLDPASTAKPPAVATALADVVETIELPPGTDLGVLAGLHGYAPGKIEKRRDFRPQLPLLAVVVRVRPLVEPVTLGGIDVTGCASWVKLPDTIEVETKKPVLDDHALRATTNALRERLGGGR